MNRTFFLVPAIILSSLFISKAQSGDNAWQTLSMVQITKDYDADMGVETIKANFSPIVQALDGTEITVKGYIIPLTGKRKQSHFMFSSLPVNMCFFCGKAGPESAMQVFMKDDKKVAFTEKSISVRGVLRLSQGDGSGLIYTLESAELIR